MNPYGVAIVPASAGKLVAGDTLVSNFNSKANVQGTGTTLVEVSPKGSLQLFADLGHLPANQSCPGGVGLTTALGILPGGWVVVGSLATAAGGALPSQDPVGCLIVLNSAGTPVETITNTNVVGPWDMAVISTPTTASLFISNALGGNTSTNKGVPVAGNCTVVRIDLSLSTGAPPKVTGTTVIGTNYPWKADKAALVLAPTGLALSPSGILYVDDSQTNTISAIPDAATRTTPLTAAATKLTSGGDLNAPLGMIVAPNGNLIVVNGNDGNATEVTPAGTQIATKTLVKNGAGALFGLAIAASSNGIVFVNDSTNALDLDHASTTTTPTASATTTKTTVGTATTKLGTVLVDSHGMTLYTFSGDTAPGTSKCTGGCATAWPPLAVTGTPTYAASLTASKFTTITRSDGTKQLAYNGKPLYTFASDAAPGDTTGQGVGGFTVAAAG